MSDIDRPNGSHRPRRFLLVLAALLLPAATCGLTPSLEELLRRIELVEGRTSRLEQFAANARLPLVLMDEHDIVVGTVLAYGGLYLFASANSASDYDHYEIGPSADFPGDERATVLFEPHGHPSVLLEAHRDELVTREHGYPQWFYFEAADCSGPPYVNNRLSDPAVFRRAWIPNGSSTLYVLDPETPRDTQVLVHAYRVVAGNFSPTETECLPFEPDYPQSLLNLYRLEPVADLSAYTPPFRVVDQRELFGF